MKEADFSLLKALSEKEKEIGCYDIHIHEIAIYNFVRRFVRIAYIKNKGATYSEKESRGNVLNVFLSVCFSLFHILFCCKRRKPILFHTFRLENINGLWMDRFYDPIIELSNIKNDYAIIETNKGRIHKNRIHKEQIVYDDFFVILSKVISVLFYAYYVKYKYRKEFIAIDDEIKYLIKPSEHTSFYNKIIICGLLRVKFYSWYLKRNGIKYVVSASRSSFLPLLCAAKLNNVKIYELQHGVEFGEALSYSGYRDSMFTPDKFLAFGKTGPWSVYGIKETDIITIGWALKDYLSDLSVDSNITKSDVLVLSQPLSTDYIINTTLFLAENFPSLRFFIRYHPLDIVTEQQKLIIQSKPNVLIQEPKDTFIIAIKPFEFVLGDQSTTVYEALSYGKKVGLLAIDNHPVKLLKQEDLDCFWIIRNKQDFGALLNGEAGMRKTYSIYSPFDKELFNSLV